jgi:hypothetical protein
MRVPRASSRGCGVRQVVLGQPPHAWHSKHLRPPPPLDKYGFQPEEWGIYAHEYLGHWLTCPWMVYSEWHRRSIFLDREANNVMRCARSGVGTGPRDSRSYVAAVAAESIARAQAAVCRLQRDAQLRSTTGGPVRERGRACCWCSCPSRDVDFFRGCEYASVEAVERARLAWHDACR